MGNDHGSSSLCPPEKTRAVLSTLSLAAYVVAVFAVMRLEREASGRWYRDLDDLWSNVLSYFEKRGILSEDGTSLQRLVGDPIDVYRRRRWSTSMRTPSSCSESMTRSHSRTAANIVSTVSSTARSYSNCHPLPSVSFGVSEGSPETRQVPGIDVRWPGPLHACLRVPRRICAMFQGAVPTQDEWAYYLRLRLSF